MPRRASTPPPPCTPPTPGTPGSPTSTRAPTTAPATRPPPCRCTRRRWPPGCASRTGTGRRCSSRRACATSVGLDEAVAVIDDVAARHPDSLGVAAFRALVHHDAGGSDPRAVRAARRRRDDEHRPGRRPLPHGRSPPTPPSFATEPSPARTVSPRRLRPGQGPRREPVRASRRRGPRSRPARAATRSSGPGSGRRAATPGAARRPPGRSPCAARGAAARSRRRSRPGRGW